MKTPNVDGLLLLRAASLAGGGSVTAIGLSVAIHRIRSPPQDHVRPGVTCCSVGQFAGRSAALAEAVLGAGGRTLRTGSVYLNSRAQTCPGGSAGLLSQRRKES